MTWHRFQGILGALCQEAGAETSKFSIISHLCFPCVLTWWRERESDQALWCLSLQGQ